MESLARWLGWPMLSHFSDSIMHVIYWRPVSSSPIIIRQQSSIITDHCKTITIFLESFWNQYDYKFQPFRYYHQGQTCQTTITITQSSVPTQEIGLTDFWHILQLQFCDSNFGLWCIWCILWTKTYTSRGNMYRYMHVLHCRTAGSSNQDQLEPLKHPNLNLGAL